MMRRQITLLPPHEAPAFITQLERAYPDVYCLADSAKSDPQLTTVAFPELGTVEGECPAMPAIPDSQIAVVVFTSGSTGTPVPHPKTWRTLVASGSAECARLGLDAASRVALLGTVPPQHMYGLESTVLMPMQGGLTLHSGRPFYPADICAELDALPRPRVLVTTPVHLRALLADCVTVPVADLIVCATAPLAPQLAAAAQTRFRAPLYEIYGCTEAGQIATRQTADPEWRTLPGISLRQDEKGTWVRGGHVEDETLLNDMIELHGRERFLLHGRNADLVNIAGRRTSLANLNYHLNSIEGVQDGVFVIPQENGEAVSRLAAFVVAPGLSQEVVMKSLRERIDPAFLPRPLNFVDELPRNATGKLSRAALDAMSSELATREG
jgi:acyl-coenzyme A synthetase/AMP-(fatty) acid ligase